MTRRLLLTLAVAGCDPTACPEPLVDDAGEPDDQLADQEPAGTLVSVVARTPDECAAIAPALWGGIAFWQNRGVAWRFGGCTVDQHPGEIVVQDGAVIDTVNATGLRARGPGVWLHVVDSITYLDGDEVATHAGFVTRPDEAECGVVGGLVPTASPELVAHELGHAAGLDHRDEPDATMNPWNAGDQVEDWERLFADYWVGERERLCP